MRSLFRFSLRGAVCAMTFVFAVRVAAAVDAPVSPNPLPEVGALLRFLDSISGEYVLSGQQEFPGWTDESKDNDFDYILRTTGRRPAVRGFDFLFYTHSPAGRAGQRSTERAIAWARAGGIVTFCIHFFVNTGSPPNNPQFYVPGASSGNAGTTFDIRQAVIEGTPENRELIEKMDLMAVELKKLRDARVPVLWRPFHECSGGWFWWGAQGPQPFIALWRLMFDRYTRVHGLNNLIWIYNPTDSTTRMQSWYPGDDVVDMISLDVYPPAGTHPTYAADYQRMRAFKNGRKLVALSENGAIPDPDQLFAENAPWSYFCTWNGFENNPAQNSAEFVTRVYQHPKVLTLERLVPLFNARAFTIAAPPAPQLVAAGQPLSLSVSANDSAPLSYQWFKNGAAIAGATSSTYAAAAASPAHAGDYTVAVTGSGGTLTSMPAPVALAAQGRGRIVNLSVLSGSSAADPLTTGFVLGGEAGTKPVLLRGIGPSLSAFGVSGFVADPSLQLHATPALANENWETNATGSPAALAAAFNQVGAFALPAGSRDAALIASLAPGAYTASVTGPTAGTVLAEVYDTLPNSGARLINISARGRVGTGSALAAGFVISGGPQMVLVRGIAGNTLAGFGVGGVLANPRLELFRDSTLIATNEDWAGGATAVGALQPIFARIGAFPIDPSTRDAVLLVTLEPGTYSARVNPGDPGSGVALVEVYEVP